MEYTKEYFSMELRKLRDDKKNGYLSERGEGMLLTAEKYENLILFGVGIELPTEEEITFEDWANQNFNKYPELVYIKNGKTRTKVEFYNIYKKEMKSNSN